MATFHTCTDLVFSARIMAYVLAQEHMIMSRPYTPDWHHGSCSILNLLQHLNPVHDCTVMWYNRPFTIMV